VKLRCVVIGINAYADDSIPELAFARADALRLAECLTNSGFGPDIDVRVLVDGDATRENVVRAIGTDLVRLAAPDDIVLVYFACHGAPELSGPETIARYLVCHDTDMDSLIATSIDVNADLQRLADRIPASLVCFITDACYSGYRGGRGILGPRLAERRRQTRAQAALSELRLGQGTVFLGAASDDEVAWESSALKHGVFSWFLLSELTDPASGPQIGLSTLYDRVYGKVHDYTGGRQSPVLYGAVRGAGLPVFANRKSTE
jgi:uncharacterized caspase-like protein